MDLTNNPFLSQADRDAALAPRSEAQALRRRLVAIGLAGAALIGAAGAVRGGYNLITSEDQPRPTHPVTVEQGDVSPVWTAADNFAEAENVSREDVVQDINDASPDLRDGYANAGDIMNVPMTDAQIAEQEEESQS